MFFSIIHTLKNSTKTVSKDVPTTIAKVMTAPECIGMGSRENNSYIIFKWNIFLFVMHKKYLSQISLFLKGRGGTGGGKLQL